MTESPHLNRRTLLGCAALYGVAGPILSACSSDRAEEGATGDGTGSGTPGDQTSSDGNGGQATGGLVAAADVPVGGGVALVDQRIVVVQPTEGEFKAYSGSCTHQGRTIDKVEDGAMVCPLHGSRFAVEDGSVEQGPATSPLPEVQVRVRDGQVVRA